MRPIVLFAWLATACADPAVVDCADGLARCSELAFERCVGGQWTTVETCGSLCDEARGCLTCEPSTARCDGQTSIVCSADGTSEVSVECDETLGLSCGASGRCEGPCATLGRSYEGCEFYPVTMGSSVRTDLPFGVGVANLSDTDVRITVDGGELTTSVSVIAPGGSATPIELPWVLSLKLCGTSGDLEIECDPSTAIDASGPAYRLRASGPVIVYQFSPLVYVADGIFGSRFAYSADASLLLPVNAWGSEYVAATRERWLFGARSMPSEVVIVAGHDDTEVTVVSNANTSSTRRGEPYTFPLNRGDAYELLAFDGDLTGTVVSSSRPVQVLAGHFVTRIPADIQAADHLEETMLPTASLGREYVVAPPARNIPGMENGTDQEVRIVAAEDDVEIEYDPPVQGAPTFLARKGTAITLGLQDRPLYIRASGRILVSQLMRSGLNYVTPYDPNTPEAGDPAMTIAVPLEQLREDYVFYAPVDYEANFATLIAKEGTRVTLDGEELTPAWQPVGSSEWRVVHVRLGDGNEGSHRLSADDAIGLQVYGFGSWTSYWYPGGLDVDELVF
jgi:hypothetical protein